ncbi:MAG: iron ABC transporter permease [Spirochaetales bacterium]|nr:iron ABC transporter permease [Spirochaetales bacterium]
METVKNLLLYSVILFAAVMLTLTIGRYPVTGEQLLTLFRAPEELDNTVRIVFLTVRLPRILAALFVGAALAGSGAVYQTIFKNPMVSPSVLGASSGAAFGAALALLLGMNQWAVQLLSFLCGVGAVFLALLIAAAGRGKNKTLLLVLSGMLVSTFFTALISLVKFLADPQNTLPAITYWLMGSLADSDMNRTLFMGAVVLICGVVLYLLRWRIAILSLDDEEARSLGIDPGFLRLIVVICATLLTSTAVSISGVIGWVGLVVPHMVRLKIPNRFSSMFGASLFGGALYLLFIDTITRTASSIELPLGVLTSLIGAPFFAFFLLGRGRS